MITINGTGSYPYRMSRRFEWPQETFQKEREIHIRDLENALKQNEKSRVIKEAEIIDSIHCAVEGLRGRDSIIKYVDNLIRVYEGKIQEYGEEIAIQKLIYVLSRYNPSQYSEIHNCWKKVYPEFYETKMMKVAHARFDLDR